MAEEEKATGKEFEIKHEKTGKVTFNDDVVATIAGLATIEIPGVAGMSGGFSAGVAEMLGRKNFTKGVKVEVGSEECAIDLHLIVEYGAKIPEVCENIQKNVRATVETMTGLKVIEINVHIQGVQIDKPEKKEPEVVRTPPVEPEPPRVR